MNDQTLGFGREKRMDELGRNHSNHLHNKTILQKKKSLSKAFSPAFEVKLRKLH